MKLKKFAALMLAILALVSVFAGCGKKEEEENIYPGKYGLAYNKFAPDEVIMTVGDSDVTWQEFYFYMTSAVIDIENAFGLSSITDWTESATDDLTIEEYVMTSAVENAKYYHTIVSMAPELGVEVTEEVEAVVDSLVDKGIEQAGSQEAFEEHCLEEPQDRFRDKKLTQLQPADTLHWIQHGERLRQMGV